MRANEFLTELWTQPYPLESRAIGPADREYLFTTSDDRRGRIVFDSALDTDQGGPHILFVVVHFYIDNEFHDTGRGDAIKIFSTVVTACRDYMKKFNPPVVVLESESRKKRSLYIKMANEFPNYVIYPDWAKDRELGQEIDNASVNGIRDEMLVLRRKDFDPKKTRVYIESRIKEMAGSVHQGIRNYLISRGYQYIKSGIDKHVFREPNTGQIFLVFGTRSGYKDQFTPDQLMFRDWINYCNKNQNNPNLPKFSGLESFNFKGQRYLQAKMEPLQEVPEKIAHLLGYLEDVVGYSEQPENMLQAIRGLAKKGYYDEEENEIIMYQIRQIIEYLGGPDAAYRLLKTVQDVIKFGVNHGYSIDLHRGNYMQRANGTIVVNDPFVVWLKNEMRP